MGYEGRGVRVREVDYELSSILPLIISFLSCHLFFIDHKYTNLLELGF
jgi:hypothetical protein